MESKTHYINNSVQNFSPYQFSANGYTALSYELGHHIPTRLNKNRIHTEFEQFYQGISKGISHIPEKYLSSLKTNLQNTCEKHSKIRVPYKYKKAIDQLSRIKNLCIPKQDKGRGVVIMDKTKYTNQCLEMLETNQFIKTNPMILKNHLKEIYNDYNARKIQRNFKSRLSQKEYKQLYPTGPCAGKFYGSTKPANDHLMAA